MIRVADEDRRCDIRADTLVAMRGARSTSVRYRSAYFANASLFLRSRVLLSAPDGNSRRPARTACSALPHRIVAVTSRFMAPRTIALTSAMALRAALAEWCRCWETCRVRWGDALRSVATR